MNRIGGNLTAVIQKKRTNIHNSIGEKTMDWIDTLSVLGWLDLLSGDSKYTPQHAKAQESTHIFICGYQNLNQLKITSHNARLIVQGNAYDITLIDNPMQLDQHLELYLKRIGEGNE